MSFKHCRPEGAFTPTDKKLSKISKKIEQFLRKENNAFIQFIDAEYFSGFADIIVEFAEDTWFEIGMWAALEKFNKAEFGNPLPLSKPESVDESDFPFDEYRLCHFLWNARMMIYPDDYVSPHHPDILPLAKRLSYLLEAEFEKLPKQSSVTRFLQRPHKDGAEVKRKLVWLGTGSYLFRWLYGGYLYDHDATGLSFRERIPYTDDFLCQETTIWSGLGCLDILAEIINLTDVQKAEVKLWYERHLAIYQVIEVNAGEIKAKNLINDEIYRIDDDNKNTSSIFKENMMVQGSTVPFDGLWYWSGNQSLYRTIAAEKIEEISKQFYEKNSTIAYRYLPEKAAIARKQSDEYYEHFVKYFGAEMKEFDTGRAAAEALVTRMKTMQVERIEEMKAAGETPPNIPDFSIKPEDMYPEDFLESDKGVLLMYNKGNGEEIILNYKEIKTALQKEGIDLLHDEKEALYHFVSSSDVSKETVEKTVEKYGGKSIAVAFFLKRKPSYWLSYLLHKYKGQDYRNRYPKITVVNRDYLA